MNHAKHGNYVNISLIYNDICTFLTVSLHQIILSKMTLN